eukprot:CAMPEP_0172506270 /NCGR_PEP_ID=MMETSP1066-20121228/193352_1 /TAXON_ID=671091 /ORGANISM="Coscinodiscus wailesii, Strain CCMP2513" /LENGTH=535 /DNA_ID=CAMNT_0013283221 /DNA_START=127 /DNA_END=1734 /DNA_ORIENTATION=-
MTSIHWFRNGLRLHDNPPLLHAISSSERLLPLYVIDPSCPFAQTPDRKPTAIRANFVLESLTELNEKLVGMNSRLIVLKGDPATVLPAVAERLNATSLIYERESAAPVKESDRRVFAALTNKCQNVTIKGYDTHNLHPMERYASSCPGGVAPASYGSFCKLFAKMGTVDAVCETVSCVPPLPDGVDEVSDDFDGWGVPTLESLGYDGARVAKNDVKGVFKGGEDEALKRLTKMMSRKAWVAKFEKPKTSPNSLEPDTTGLSPYVKHGCLSPRKFYHELSKIYALYDKKHSLPPVSLHGQLLWREYNYLTGYTTPHFDKMLNNPVARQIPWDDDPTLLAAWKNSRTGYPFIDAIMTQLRETGWIHHLARHAAACFLTRGDLWQSWEKGAEVFERELIDADWSINNFNWQWLSCTAHFYQYFRCYSPVAFGKKTDPNGDYIRKWLPIFKKYPAKYIYEPWKAPLSVQRGTGVVIGVDYPKPIVDHTVVSKANMGRMKEAYDRHKLMQSQGNGQGARGNRSSADSGTSVSRKRRKTTK